MFDTKATLLYFCAGCKEMGKGNMDKNGPYNTKSFRNNRPVVPFFSGNSAIFMPTTTVSYSPILQAHHTTTQSNVTPFVEAIRPQAGLSPNIRECAPNIHKITLGLLFRLYSACSLRMFLTVLKQISLRMTWLKLKEFGVMSSSPMMKPLLNVHVLVTYCRKGLVRFSWQKLSIRLSSASLCLPLT